MTLEGFILWTRLRISWEVLISSLITAVKLACRDWISNSVISVSLCNMIKVPVELADTQTPLMILPKEEHYEETKSNKAPQYNAVPPLLGTDPTHEVVNAGNLACSSDYPPVDTC